MISETRDCSFTQSTKKSEEIKSGNLPLIILYIVYTYLSIYYHLEVTNPGWQVSAVSCFFTFTQWVVSETQGQGVGAGYTQSFQEEAVHACVYARVCSTVPIFSSW